MNELENAIKEMAKVLDEIEAIMWENAAYDTSDMAKAFYNAGYRQVKDKVVLDKEEYQNDFSSQFNKGYEKGSKETAREIFNKLYNYLPPREKANVEIKKSSLEDVEKVTLQMYKCLKDDVRELAKEYGVEVEE